MSVDIIPRYVVLPSLPVIEPAGFYVLDQADSPARTAAVCATRDDAMRACAGLELLDVLEIRGGNWLELLHVLEINADEPTEIAAPNPAWAGS